MPPVRVFAVQDLCRTGLEEHGTKCVARSRARRAARHAGTPKELLIRMKRLPVFVLLLAVASIIPAAGQTAAAPPAQRPAAAAAVRRPSQGRCHRLSGRGHPDQ